MHKYKPKPYVLPPNRIIVMYTCLDPYCLDEFERWHESPEEAEREFKAGEIYCIECESNDIGRHTNFDWLDRFTLKPEKR